jgi:hypothetical protein
VAARQQPGLFRLKAQPGGSAFNLPSRGRECLEARAGQGCRSRKRARELGAEGIKKEIAAWEAPDYLMNRKGWGFFSPVVGGPNAWT